MNKCRKDEWNFTLMIFICTCNTKKNWININKVCGWLDFVVDFFFAYNLTCIVHYFYSIQQKQQTKDRSRWREPLNWYLKQDKLSPLTDKQTHTHTGKQTFVSVLAQTKICSTKVGITRNTARKIFETWMWAKILFLFNVAWSAPKRKQMSVYLCKILYNITMCDQCSRGNLTFFYTTHY